MSFSLWAKYYDIVEGESAHRTILTALRLFQQENEPSGFCVDIGFGNGADALVAVANGWTVLAIDKEDTALERLQERLHANVLPEEFARRVKLYCGPMEELSWPANKLTNAGLSLPFCHPEQFSAVWIRLINNIQKNGRFSGHFFGLRDTWAKKGNLVHLSIEQIHKLFAGFTIELFDELEYDGYDASGNFKHWHIIQVVAKKQ